MCHLKCKALSIILYGIIVFIFIHVIYWIKRLYTQSSKDFINFLQRKPSGKQYFDYKMRWTLTRASATAASESMDQSTLVTDAPETPGSPIKVKGKATRLLRNFFRFQRSQERIKTHKEENKMPRTPVKSTKGATASSRMKKMLTPFRKGYSKMTKTQATPNKLRRDRNGEHQRHGHKKHFEIDTKPTPGQQSELMSNTLNLSSPHSFMYTKSDTDILIPTQSCGMEMQMLDTKYCNNTTENKNVSRAIFGDVKKDTIGDTHKRANHKLDFPEDSDPQESIRLKSSPHEMVEPYLQKNMLLNNNCHINETSASLQECGTQSITVLNENSIIDQCATEGNDLNVESDSASTLDYGTEYRSLISLSSRDYTKNTAYLDLSSATDGDKYVPTQNSRDLMKDSSMLLDIESKGLISPNSSYDSAKDSSSLNLSFFRDKHERLDSTFYESTFNMHNGAIFNDSYFEDDYCIPYNNYQMEDEEEESSFDDLFLTPPRHPETASTLTSSSWSSTNVCMGVTSLALRSSGRRPKASCLISQGSLKSPFSGAGTPTTHHDPPRKIDRCAPFSTYDGFKFFKEMEESSTESHRAMPQGVNQWAADQLLSTNSDTEGTTARFRKTNDSIVTITFDTHGDKNGLFEMHVTDVPNITDCGKDNQENLNQDCCVNLSDEEISQLKPFVNGESLTLAFGIDMNTDRAPRVNGDGNVSHNEKIQTHGKVEDSDISGSMHSKTGLSFKSTLVNPEHYYNILQERETLELQERLFPTTTLNNNMSTPYKLNAPALKGNRNSFVLEENYVFGSHQSTNQNSQLRLKGKGECTIEDLSTQQINISCQHRLPDNCVVSSEVSKSIKSVTSGSTSARAKDVGPVALRLKRLDSGYDSSCCGGEFSLSPPISPL